MHLVTSIKEIRTLVREARALGKSVGLAPTMGALHEGHLSLIRQAKRQCDVVIVSIFVNPTQFGPNEDYDRYPRLLDRDFDLLDSYNVDAAFAPSIDEMYPEGFQTFVDPGPMARLYEGSVRPGHFRGVATVVIKLLNIVQPDMAYFGQKDFQQTIVIRRLVEDLNLHVRLIFCPTVRERDGLAVSSRNVLLSPDDREAALAISRSLARAEEIVHAGECKTAKILTEMRRILKGEPRLALDYAAIVNPTCFEPVDRVTTGAVALVAARTGSVRLIDNVIFGPPGSSPEERLQAALSSPAVTDASTRIPGIDAETVKLKVESCRDCAAISTILLPPQEFMAKYLKRDYPDLNTVRVAVIGRHASARAENFYYLNSGKPNRFVAGIYELLGVKEFSEFKPRFVLTDIIRCHATGPRVPEKAMANCSRHLRNELHLFPNLDTLVILGEDAYIGVQRFLLEHDPADIRPFQVIMGSHGWAEESVQIPVLENRRVRIFYCYHPSLGYQQSPSIASFLQI